MADDTSSFDALINKVKDVESAFVTALSHASMCENSNGRIKLHDALQQIKEITRRCELRLSLEDDIAGSRDSRDKISQRSPSMQAGTCQILDLESSVHKLRHDYNVLKSCLLSEQQRKGLGKGVWGRKGIGFQKGQGKIGKRPFLPMDDIAPAPLISELEFEIHDRRWKFNACLAKHPISSSINLCKLLEIDSLLDSISLFVGLDWGYYEGFDFKLFPWSDRWDEDYRGIALDRLSAASKQLRRLSRAIPWVKAVVSELADVLWKGAFPENIKYIEEKREYNCCEHFERKGSCHHGNFCRYIHCSDQVRGFVCVYILMMYDVFPVTHDKSCDITTKGIQEFRFRRSIRRCVAELDNIQKPASEAGFGDVRSVLKKYVEFLGIPAPELDFTIHDGKGKGKGKEVIVVA